MKERHTKPSFSNSLQPTLALLIMLVMTMMTTGKVWGQRADDPNEIIEIDDVEDLNGIGTTGNYVITKNIDASRFETSIATFGGTLEANIDPNTKMPYRIQNLSVPLFTTLTGTVKNLVLEDVDISTSGSAGAIAVTMQGTKTNIACIYNCGILSGNVGGGTGTDDHIGGLVGNLGVSGNNNNNCYARVINCYSFANITSGTEMGGIVGHNYYSSKSGNNTIRTMVMNCMYYGNIHYTDNVKVYPIYGGLEISNEDGNKLNNYNYFLYEADFSMGKHITAYNRALAAEERYLVRFEFYRYLLNANRELASWYVFGSVQTDAHTKMHKWVLDKSIAPYPILKVQGIYPSVVNYDPNNTFDSESGQMKARTSITGQNKGKNLGTLTVNISIGTGFPTDAAIKQGKDQITLQRTDKDFDDYNFNYDKVQLPYYVEVGTGNCTYNKVVTGWKITKMEGGTQGEFNPSDEWNGYNFADRSTFAKDLFSVSGRVFSQGAYFDVPDGVTEIYIEPYWGNAVYLSDPYYDAYGYYANEDLNNIRGVTDFGVHYTEGTSTINGQPVYTYFFNALSQLHELGCTTSTNVYDNAIVLVGNYHYCQKQGVDRNDDKPFSIMSADLDEDNEPDYSLILNTGKDVLFYPVRFDFVNAIGTAMAHKKNGTYMGIIGTVKWAGWLEVTNTSFIRFSQLNRESEKRTTIAPLILMGGVVEQIVSTNGTEGSTGKTNYMHFGSNVWFKMFSNGCHADKTNTKTPHVPISVTGGDYEKFYLSGYFQPAAPYNANDHAECYVSGGRFEELAGSGQEKIDGNVTWLIDHADITDFFGGGINEKKPISGDITTTIKNSYVNAYYGGPKFGNMSSGKTVKTTAVGCTFGNYFGAGYGGTALVRIRTFNAFGQVDYNWNTDSNMAPTFASSNGGNKRGKYSSDNGISINYEYEHFEGSNDKTVARFYVNYASLSLAKTNNVTSELTNCTITHNFYGAGSLGKVDGHVVSTLINCIVGGNVYGAGLSATPPTANVFNAAVFVTPPVYNQRTGVFEKGVFPASIDYTWSNSKGGNTDATTLVDDDEGYWIHTDVSLSDLGRVTQNVTLTISTSGDGSSTIGTEGNPLTGNVYGGGDESAVTGNTTVILQGSAHVLGNVYGGGNNGAVGGNSEVKIEDPQNTGN